MFKHEITFDRFIRWMIIALIVLAVYFTVNYLSAVLLPFFIAWFLAYLMFPIVQFIENRLHIRVRALSIVLTLIVVIGVLTGIVMLTVPPMINQFDKLGSLATKYIEQAANITSIPDAIKDLALQNKALIQHYLNSDDFTNTVKEAMPKVLNFVSSTFSVLYSVIGSCITLLYLFFILQDYEKLSDNWVKIFPVENRPFLNDLKKDVAHALNSYIRGQGLVALTMGILFCIGFTIIDLPMAIGLGILIGVLDLVPYLHTFAIIPAGFLALLKAADTGQNFWVLFALVILIFCVVQVIIDFIVTPRIMGKAMGMNPAILLLSLSIWGTLLGFIGLIIALPLTTIIIAYWQMYITKDRPSSHN